MLMKPLLLWWIQPNPSWSYTAVYSFHELHVEYFCIGGPPYHPQVQQFSKKMHKIQYLVVRMAMIYYSDGRQSNIRMGKGTWGKVQGNQAQASESSRRGVTQDPFNSPSKGLWQRVKCSLPGKLTRDLVTKVSTGGWSYSHTLPSMIQNSRLLEGKWVFRIKHIVFTNCLGMVSHSCQEMLGTLLKSKFPDASQGPTS